jgi:hypothetical protein
MTARASHHPKARFFFHAARPLLRKNSRKDILDGTHAFIAEHVLDGWSQSRARQMLSSSVFMASIEEGEPGMRRCQWVHYQGFIIGRGLEQSGADGCGRGPLAEREFWEQYWEVLRVKGVTEFLGLLAQQPDAEGWKVRQADHALRILFQEMVKSPLDL